MRSSPMGNKNLNIKYKVEDILVLNKLNKTPTFIKDPLKTISGHIHSLEVNNKYINFSKVVSNIKKKELIRESTPRELLKYLTIPDLKFILKNISKPIYGNKNELITRIDKYATDEDIINSTEKRYFVLTELGLEILNKYSNVTWISKNKYYIYLDSLNGRNKFNEVYFLKHWDILDPIEIMVDYYKGKDSGIVARLYELDRNLEYAFYYGVKKISKDINYQVELCKEYGWFDPNIRFEDFGINHIRFRKIFNYLNISDESLEKTLKYIYRYSIEETSLIDFDTYKKIIILTLKSEDDLHEETVKGLCQTIRKQCGHKLYDEVYSYYNNKNDEEMEKSLLEILNILSTDEEHNENIILESIDELDSKTIDKIKIKIDKRLSEK